MKATALRVCVLASVVGFTLPASADDLDICSNSSSNEAIGACSRLIQSGAIQGRQLASVYYNRGTLFVGRAQFDAAIADFDRAIQHYPEYDRAFNNRCFARVALNRDLEDALFDCDRALQLRANYAAAYNSRGFVFLRLGRFSDALSDFDARLRLESKAASSLYGRGIAKIRRGDKAGGEADISAARSIDANAVERYRKYGFEP